MTVSISIDYKTLNSSDWKTLELTPEEYFDKVYFEEYPDEEFEWDSLPEFEDAVDYIDLELEMISHTRIRIFDDKKNISRTFSEALWNNGENYIVERVDKYPEKVEELIIMNIKLRDDPSEWEILRIQKVNGVPMIELHSVITDKEDGSQEERIIYPIDERDNS
jgi:hypothetical protein